VPLDLDQRMGPGVEERASLQKLGDDLPHPLGRQPLLRRDVVVSPALAEPRNDAPLPFAPVLRIEPPPAAGWNCRLIHLALAHPPPGTATFLERRKDSMDCEKQKVN
jgi:hypothetical protein